MKAGKPRIGLFGGSFDPVHSAHVALATLALEALALDQLRWIPAGKPWQKARKLTAAHHRIAMIELAIGGEPRFAIDRREVERSGPSYTIDTVRSLAAEQQADWFLVIGQDQYAALHTWRDWQALLALVTLAVAARAGDAPRPSAEVAALPHRVCLLPLPPMAVSATAIRNLVARGEPVERLVPPAVASYIERNHLYRS